MNSHKDFEEITLGIKDTIECGEYAGETVESCVKKYGKNALLNVLKYYNLADEVMEYYHIRMKPHVDKEETENQVVTTRTRPVKKYVTTRTDDLYEDYYKDEDEDEVTEPIFIPVDYDPEDFL